MKATETTINNLFRQSVRYVIPSYQRNYTWEADDQWNPLWEDIVGVAEKVLGAGDSTPSHTHFMGAIITKYLGRPGHIYEHMIVDGQQRLTTMVLAMAALRRVLLHRGHKRPASRLNALLVNDEADRLHARDTLKLQPKGHDYQTFDTLLMASLDGSSPPDASLLGRCYRFFHQAGSSWLADVPHRSGRSESELASQLVETIRERLQFAAIRLHDENEHAIFEALNARGKRLTEWEKTKSYLLSLAAVNTTEARPHPGDWVYEQHLQHLDDDGYWAEEERVTRFAGPRVDWFLYNWLQVRLARRVPAETVYREFRRHCQETIGGASDYAAQLKALVDGAARFRALVGRKVDSSGGRGEMDEISAEVLGRILTLGLTSLLPPLLAIYVKEGTEEDWRSATRVFDSYIMRRLAVNARFASVDDAAQQLLQGICPEPCRRAALAKLISSLEEQKGGNRWPSDEELERKVVTNPIYGNAAAYRIRWILEAVAPHYTPSEAGVPFNSYTKFEIEHVIPQEWKNHWRTVPSEDEDVEAITHCFGNLTIVTSRMNRLLANHAWREKRELLSRDTIAMNQEIARSVPEGEEWDRRHVRRRGEDLARIMVRLWPNPATLKGELSL